MDDWAVAAGVAGVRRVLAALNMIDGADAVPDGANQECRTSGWVRARNTGILMLDVDLGQHVSIGQRLGVLTDSFGKTVRLVRADRAGIVIGRAQTPLVNSGDALVHIAQ